ncbi:MAG: hypothetical protein Q7R73_02920 [bacterium]|nr:hypothetical protein [bacterium]
MNAKKIIVAVTILSSAGVLLLPFVLYAATPDLVAPSNGIYIFTAQEGYTAASNNITVEVNSVSYPIGTLLPNSFGQTLSSPINVNLGDQVDIIVNSSAWGLIRYSTNRGGRVITQNNSNQCWTGGSNENPFDVSGLITSASGLVSFSCWEDWTDNDHNDFAIRVEFTADAPQPPSTATIVATKIVCNAESDLPNWGGGGPNVTSSTASNFLASHPNCHLEPNWKFQWGDQSVFEPSGSFIGEAGSGWHTFGPTNTGGITSVNVPLASISRIWVREVLKSGYIPFSGASSGTSVSAEMYCNQDVLIYDNYDYIDNPQNGATYQCIAFNALSAPAPQPPTADIAANPSSIIQGNSSVLSWSSNNADICTASVGWSGGKSLSGSQTVTPNQTTTYTITCSNSAGSDSDSATITVTPVQQPQPPTVTISASPNSIIAGDSSVLSWSSSNATSCTASNGWSGNKSLSGSQTVTPNQTTSYIITCSNSAGSASDSTTVSVTPVQQPQLPTVDIIANPGNIIEGNSSILSWSSSNATSCTASNGWSGTKNLSGSQVVTPAQTKTYTITCSNSTGSASDSTTVSVSPEEEQQSPLPTVNIVANPSSIIQGNSSILSWSSANADSCIASGGWSGTKNLSGSQVVTPFQTTGYTITCSNNSGQAQQSTTVTVTPQPQQQIPPTVSIVANPSSIFQGNTSILTWSSANADYCTASGGWSGTQALSGSQIVQPNQTTIYTIVCTNNSGQAQTSATVFVSPQQQTSTPTVTIIASPQSITQGNSSVLTWTSSNATSCSASGGWFGSKTISGSDIVTPSVTTTYDIVCYGINGGSATNFVTVSVTSPNPINIIEAIKTVRNITTNQTTFSSFITAQNLNTVEFNIRIKNLSSNQTWNVFVSDTLPPELFYVTGSTRSNLSVMPDGIVGGGLSLTLGPNEERLIQFRAIVASGALQKTIINTATIRVNNQTFNSTGATVQIGGQVLGIATVIPTGPDIPTQWLIAFGFIGALAIYLVSFMRRYQGKLSLASAFSDARLQFKIWRIKRGDNIEF